MMNGNDPGRFLTSPVMLCGQGVWIAPCALTCAFVFTFLCWHLLHPRLTTAAKNADVKVTIIRYVLSAIMLSRLKYGIFQPKLQFLIFVASD